MFVVMSQTKHVLGTTLSSLKLAKFFIHPLLSRLKTVRLPYLLCMQEQGIETENILKYFGHFFLLLKKIKCMLVVVALAPT